MAAGGKRTEAGVTRSSEGGARGYAVTHLPSGARDGWYVYRADAERMLGWFRALFPQDRFELTRPRFEGDSVSEKRLDHSAWRQWSATTAPDYPAAARYDREATTCA